MKIIYRADSSIAFTTALVFGFCGVGFTLIAIGEGTFINARYALLVYFLLVLVCYLCCKYGTYITITNAKLQGTVFFVPFKKTDIKDVYELKEEANFGGLINQVLMLVLLPNGKTMKRGLTSKEMLSKEDFNDLIIEIQKINPSVIIPPSLLK